MMRQPVSPGRPQALEGLRVVDLGHALAAPFAATMLADFGAEVLKVERPHVGDPMRNLGPRKGDLALWWKAAARNKKSITLDFAGPRGKELLLKLIEASDVVVENFRPGTLERHGLGWEDLKEANPRLVMLRISGFGQTGPHAGRPGFGRVAEAMSGAAQLTGFPDRAPVHAGYSLADTVTGLMGAFGVVLALVARDRDQEGECIDLALYEPLFRLIDWQVIAYDQLGIVPERRGNAFPSLLGGVVAGVSRSSDGVWLTYSAATDSVLCRLIGIVLGREALEREELATPSARAEHTQLVEEGAIRWIEQRTAQAVETEFGRAEAVISRIYDLPAIWADEGYRARENIIEVADPDCGQVAMHGVVPRMLGRPGRVKSTGPALGEHTREVLTALCATQPETLDELAAEGVI